MSNESTVPAVKETRPSVSLEAFCAGLVAAEKEGDYTAERVSQLLGIKVQSVKQRVKKYRDEYGLADHIKEFPAGERGAKLDPSAAIAMLTAMRANG